jgi:hypothetical protein
MLWTPTASADVVQPAVRELPEPASATPEQPAMATPPSLKFTVPVGALAVTVAVNVTLWPCVDGLIVLAMVVVDEDGPLPAVTLTLTELALAERTSIVMLGETAVSV